MTRRLFTGATVWAGASCTPRAGWLLVEDDRVAALGQTQPPPPADEVIDLTGSHVLPGFVDVHLHLSQAAWFPHGGDGMAWRSLAEALHAIRVAADAAPAAPWLLFWRIPRFAWPEGRLPTAAELDQAAPGRRVLVSTFDMHRGALSPAGLAALGLDTPRGVGGFGADVTRDRRGRPTGEVWEAAYGIALQRALADTAAQHGEQGTAAVLAAEADRCLAHGITHAHDPYVSPDLHEQMLALHATSPMRLSWATGSPAGMLSRPPGPASVPDGPYGDAGREVKLFADGAERAAVQLPSRAVLDLFAGACAEAWRMRATGPLREALRRKLILRPGHLHLPYLRYTDAELTELMAAYAAAGLVAASGATASYQPGFIPRWGHMINATGATRRMTVFAARLLLQAGVPLALSSDYPPGLLDPLHNLRAAVHRRLPSGRPWQPEQALTQSEAVRAATVT